MDKFEPFRPDEETIETWVENFENRLLCHNISNNEKKRHWCQALVGEAGRNIIKKIPTDTEWNEIKEELIEILGEPNPKDQAFNQLMQYQAKGKGLGEMASDIITKAAQATDDRDMQNKLGLKAFLKALPTAIGKELRRKHLDTVKEALDEARFLERITEEENIGKNKVLALETLSPDKIAEKAIEGCLKKLEEKGWGPPGKTRPRTSKIKCWCCGQEGHTLRQCPVITKNKGEALAAAGSTTPALN